MMMVLKFDQLGHLVDTSLLLINSNTSVITENIIKQCYGIIMFLGHVFCINYNHECNYALMFVNDLNMNLLESSMGWSLNRLATIYPSWISG